jgi:hypothetical protein
MSNIRHGIRHPFDRIRKKRNQNLLANLPEQKHPNKYLADILHKTANVQDEITKRAELYASDRAYKLAIQKRIQEAIDEYLDTLELKGKGKNNTLIDVYTTTHNNLKLVEANLTITLDRTKRTPVPSLGQVNMAQSTSTFGTTTAPLAWLGEALGYLLGILLKTTRSSSKLQRMLEASVH